jgi:hypothetical protein
LCQYLVPVLKIPEHYHWDFYFAKRSLILRAEQKEKACTIHLIVTAAFSLSRDEHECSRARTVAKKNPTKGKPIPTKPENRVTDQQGLF